MTDAKHTPGPWRVRWLTRRYAGREQPINVCLIEVPAGKTDGSFIIAEITGPFAGLRDTAEANAALIASAPDLKAERDRLLAEITVLRGGFLQAEAKHAATQAELVAVLREVLDVATALDEDDREYHHKEFNRARAALARVEAQR